MTQNAAGNRTRVEVGLDHLPRRSAVPFVVRVDVFKGRGRLLDSRESQESFAVGQERAGAGVLHNGRFAAGQITKRAVANPGILKPHARAFGATELAARLLNIRVVPLRRVGNLARKPNAPAASF